MAHTIGLAVVGCGHMARVHSLNARLIPSLDLRAFVDVDPDGARALRDQLGTGYATTDLDRALADPHVDAVLVATRWRLHASIAIAALRAGKHVLVEKPLAPTLEECQAIEAAADATGRKAMVAFNYRYAPLLWQARDIVGQPVVSAFQCMDRAWAPDYNSILDQACHSIDMLCGLHGGYPVGYQAAGGNYNGTQASVDSLVATLQFADGSVASLVQGDLGVNPHVSKWSLQLIGHERGVFVTDTFRRAQFWGCGVDELRLGSADQNTGPHGHRGHFPMLSAFADALIDGRPVPYPVSHGRAIMQIVLGLMSSAAQSTASREVALA
jgi:predicted dehydrogenase